MIDRFKNTEEAKDFILKTLKSDKYIDKDDESDFTVNTFKINKVECCNAFAKLIATAPISPICRKIMLSKIMNPGISDQRIAIIHGVRVGDVKRYEEEGKYICGKLLERIDLQEATDKYNTDEVIQREVDKLKGKDTPKPQQS